MSTRRVDSALRRMAAQALSDDEQPPAPPWQSARDGAAPSTDGLHTAWTRRRGRRRMLVGATAAAAVATVSALVVANLPAGPAYAVTPRSLTYSNTGDSVRGILVHLAARARRSPAPAGPGRYEYVHTRGWYLHADADLSNHVRHSGIAAVDRQQWIAADGSGRLRVVSAGKEIMPSGSYSRNGLVPGGITADATAAEIRQHRHIHDSAAGWANAIGDIWSEQVVPPRLQGTLLSALADQQGVTLMGETVDRAGRRGIAVSADRDSGGVRERQVLVLDQHTGRLLDQETVALTAGTLPIRAPATISYTLYLSAGYTETTAITPR